MLKKMQRVFDSSFLTPWFKILLPGSQKHIHMTRQGIHKLFARK